MLHRLFQFGGEIDIRPHRHVPHRRAGHDEAERVDRIARVRHQDRVARRGDRLGKVGETLLRAQRDDDLALGVELDIEAPRVIGGIGAAQPGNPPRCRIAVRLRVLHRLDQLGDDVRRRRAVGIAHPEIDDVAPLAAGLRLQRVDLGEDVGRQALDAVELFRHARLHSTGSGQSTGTALAWRGIGVPRPALKRKISRKSPPPPAERGLRLRDRNCGTGR